MIYDPTDTGVAMDHHGQIHFARIVGRDEEGHPIVEWRPARIVDLKGDDFTRPLW